MSFTPPSIPAKRLAVAITSAASSFQLNNILGWNGSDLTSSDLGDRCWAIFLNADKTIMEIMRIDPTTIASASITITKRGLDFKGGDSEVTANKLNWNAGETTVLLGTNPPQLYADFLNLYDAQTVAGLKTFSTIPRTTGGDPTSDTELARKAYVDASVAGGSGIPNRVVVAGTAGATIADGDLIYLDDTDNEWKLCDADTASTVENQFLGIAQGAGTDGNAITNGVLIMGVDDAQSGMTIGDIMYASNTAGDISASAGTKEVTVGFAKSATELYFMPRFNQHLTEDQQDALAPTTALSNTNKVMSQKDFQIGAENYAADAAGSDTYAITLSPAPAAYVNGMIVNFKAQTANTGAATLNVNTLGAVDITKLHDQALETGDIEANQIVTVIYNSSTAKFQMVSQVAIAPITFKNGVTTRDGTAASGDQTIAHGLSKTPKYVRISARFSKESASNAVLSDGTYNGTTQCAVWMVAVGSSVATAMGNTATQIIYLQSSGATTDRQEATIAVDGTNLTLSWTKAGNGLNANIQLLWEAYA
jgi:hypothetical protein